MICRTVLFAEETIKVNCVCLNVNQVSELISDLTTANKVQQPVSSLTDRQTRQTRRLHPEEQRFNLITKSWQQVPG